ncbi:MAG: carboxylate--amine ligase [Myxococcota bacterium]
MIDSLDTQPRSPAAKTALLGYCVPAMEALDKIKRPFVVVVPPLFEATMKEHGIEHVLWDFGRKNEQSAELAKTLDDMGVELAVPLFEETVEWAGALNGYFRKDPRLFTKYLLFRDKAMMKRRAQMNGIRVGVFEEADAKEDVHRFFKRVNKALAKLEGEVEDPVHLKPLAAAGCVGHRFIRTERDIENLEDSDFPCLLETHLDGQEFSCEVFVHNKKIRFLNITEYVHLGYSNFCPASPKLNASRKLIEKAVYELIDAFDIQYGMIHPEFFITPDGKINFGEVAARVPGGHIFELIQKAYGFDPFAGFALCADPGTTEQELADFFPDPADHKGYAGCLMVYPKQKIVTRVDVPEKLLKEPYYEKHNLYQPVTAKVAERAGFGDHYGTIYFLGDDAETMHRLLSEYEDEDFYTNDSPKLQEPQ